MTVQDGLETGIKQSFPPDSLQVVSGALLGWNCYAGEIRILAIHLFSSEEHDHQCFLYDAIFP